MPAAKPRQPPKPPAPLRPGEADYIKATVRRYYGEDAVVRNYGPDPNRLALHVETSIKPGMEQHECLGLLMCEIQRDYVGLEITRRGDRVRGSAKLAYRQGEVI
jgi:integrase